MEEGPESGSHRVVQDNKTEPFHINKQDKIRYGMVMVLYDI